MTEKLKRCPFCGGLAEILDVDDGNRFFAHCERCLANGPIEDTEKDAQISWNGRVK